MDEKEKTNHAGDPDGAAAPSAGKHERNYGIDLLRIVCMYLICILHICGQGGAMTHILGKEASWMTVYLLEAAGYCAVNTYGMISGYVGVSSRHRPSRIVELWLRVFWYSSLGTLIGVFVYHLPVESGTLWKAIFPTMWKTYWYFSSYIGVFFIAPYLNKMILALGKDARKKLLITLFLVFSVFTMVPRVSLTGSDFLGIGSGYSFVWLAVMYVMGGCIRMLEDCREEGAEPAEGKSAGRKDFLHKSTSFYVILYLICVLITWASKFVIGYITVSAFGEQRYYRLLFSYAGPTVVLSAYALLMIFSRLKIGKKPGREMIRLLSPMAFSVYLVQVQPYFWDYALKGSCTFIAGKTPAAALLLVLGCAALLYLLCTAIDIIRALVFKALNIRKCAEAFTDFVLKPFRCNTSA